MHSSAILLLSRLSGGVGDDNHQTSKKYPENVFLFLLGGELSVTSRTSLLYISETSTCRLGRYFSTDVKGRRLGKKREKLRRGETDVISKNILLDKKCYMGIKKKKDRKCLCKCQIAVGLACLTFQMVTHTHTQVLTQKNEVDKRSLTFGFVRYEVKICNSGSSVKGRALLLLIVEISEKV